MIRRILIMMLAVCCAPLVGRGASSEYLGTISGRKILTGEISKATPRVSYSFQGGLTGEYSFTVTTTYLTGEASAIVTTVKNLQKNLVINNNVSEKNVGHSASGVMTIYDNTTSTLDIEFSILTSTTVEHKYAYEIIIDPPGCYSYDVEYKKGLYGTGTDVVDTKTTQQSLKLKGAIFTRNGYVQKGWSTRSDGAVRSYDLASYYYSDSSIVLYPYWERVKVSSIDISGSPNVVSGMEATYTCIANYSDGSQSTVTPIWSVNSAESSISALGVLMPYNPGSDNITIIITATYTSDSETRSATKYVSVKGTAPKQHEIAYQPGAFGSGKQLVATKVAGIAITLSDAIFTRAGYVQKGWATSDGGSKMYDLCGSYSQDASITLYPYWETASYSVNLQCGMYGGGVDRILVKTHGIDLDLPGPIFTRIGYVQSGWVTSEINQDEFYSPYGTYRKNASTILYPRWLMNTCSISYVLDDGCFASSSYHPTSASYEDVIVVSHPNKEGFTFVGWLVKGASSTAVYGSTENSQPYPVSSESTICKGTNITTFRHLSGIPNGGICLTAVWQQKAVALEGDTEGFVSGNATTGYIVVPGKNSKNVVVRLREDIDPKNVAIHISPSVETVESRGATIKVYRNDYLISDYLDIPEPNENGVIDMTRATVKNEYVKEVFDSKRGAFVNLGADNPVIKTAPTRRGLVYTFSEGINLQGLQLKQSKIGDGEPWQPTITVSGGDSGFYSIGVSK